MPCVHAQEFDAALGEQVSMIPSGSFTEPELEVTVFKPEGDGSFPVVVIRGRGGAPADTNDCP